MTKSKSLSIVLCLMLMSLAGNVSSEPSATGWEERATVNELVLSLDFLDPDIGLSAGAKDITFPAGLSIEPTIPLPLPAFLPPGTYNIEAIIGPFGSDDPLQHLAYTGFDVQFQ